ncbi:MAG: carboxylating nicotinate-nucleotide diphosphorylase [Acidimicrobiia bacterium]|nr:carboxylating nicotinate-nucleotide diphosphorylase [Acidimicrobiia bacterium]
MNDLHPPMPAVREAVARALAEDLLPMGDITAALIPVDVLVRADIVAREEGVLAGRLCVNETFAQVDPAVVVTWSLDDGEELDPGAHIATVEGPLPAVLSGERTALNLLCHLSGVASVTRRFVRAAAGAARIRDTRKTTPGLRSLEKAAVRAGGGANHRGSLSDGILVKDNHLGGLSIDAAIRRAHLRWPGRTVEVECDTRAQVEVAVDAGADMVLLDNMTPAEVADCVKLVDGRCLVEVSGGVTIQTVGEYADAGPDLISVGAITHSAPILDIGLDLPEMEE